MDGFVVTGHLKQNLKKLSPGRHEPVTYNLAFCVCFGSELNGPPMESISRSQRAHRPASWCSFNTTPRPPLAARFREILVIFHSSGTLELKRTQRSPTFLTYERICSPASSLWGHPASARTSSVMEAHCLPMWLLPKSNCESILGKMESIAFLQRPVQCS